MGISFNHILSYVYRLLTIVQFACFPHVSTLELLVPPCTLTSHCLLVPFTEMWTFSSGVPEGMVTSVFLAP